MEAARFVAISRGRVHDGRPEVGFTLVELMVVVLIIGVLVAIAVPVFVRASGMAMSKTCQANQRTIMGTVEYARGDGADVSGATAGTFGPGGSGWHAILVPAWIYSNPTCPEDKAEYYLDVNGVVVGDNGTDISFKAGHKL